MKKEDLIDIKCSIQICINYLSMLILSNDNIEQKIKDGVAKRMEDMNEKFFKHIQ